jgi:hypothetical protein
MMDAFFALDKRERLPLRVTLHLLACKQCRTAVRLCTLAERAAAAPLFADGEVGDIDSVMEGIRAYAASQGRGREPRQFISLGRWILVGVAMILAMMCVGFVNLENNADTLQMSSYMVFGSMIAVYCAFFVGSNLDFFVKQIRGRK